MLGESEEVSFVPMLKIVSVIVLCSMSSVDFVFLGEAHGSCLSLVRSVCFRFDDSLSQKLSFACPFSVHLMPECLRLT